MSTGGTPLPISTSFAEPLNNPPKDQFIRRAEFKAAVIGNYIYFDGGQVSQRHTERKANQVNATLSIDLSNSWEIDDVEILETTYAAEGSLPALNQALMPDASRNSFYIWGGATSFGAPIPAAKVWRFDADGDVAGEWVDVTPNDDSDGFFAIKRSRDVSVASTRDAGFIFGGDITVETEKEVDPQGGAGYRVFNYTTQKWSEDRGVPYAENNFLKRGSAVFAPGFGPNGLIFLLGGFHDITNPDSGLDFQTLWFIDPVERKWYSQKSSGRIPGSRQYPCSVGVATSDGRFDIFMFGGNNMNGIEYSDVYVLSLPGFHWEVAKPTIGEAYKRINHACAAVGQRQLLTFGGYKRTNESGYVDSEIYWREPDPWAQGIGIFDMSSWSWEGRFNAGADKYEQNKRLRNWYDEGGLDDIEWSKDAKPLFISSEEAVPRESPGSNGHTVDSGGNINVGIIAGSTVGGLVVIAALIVALLLWRRYRRRQQRRKGATVTAQRIASPQMRVPTVERGSTGTPAHHGLRY